MADLPSPSSTILTIQILCFQGIVQFQNHNKQGVVLNSTKINSTKYIKSILKEAVFRKKRHKTVLYQGICPMYDNFNRTIPGIVKFVFSK